MVFVYIIHQDTKLFYFRTRNLPIDAFELIGSDCIEVSVSYKKNSLIKGVVLRSYSLRFFGQISGRIKMIKNRIVPIVQNGA